ncbi:DNA-binding transcriptional regulator, IclR family [Thermomonospora echinospora]|uniref:DNA-binding transcriptional regulator, IclR family n=1 Tax=Thermomonospora echinospora TaxID=1992 RepID=A0A1H6CJK4_9ACTN|nr:helix-turn-helix domain-containing protein [Thermomonospora echinospora]SEG73108.1 DNA-binding transcriptional regulator, IclR family [Thermomonospora echinospora]
MSDGDTAAGPAGSKTVDAGLHLLEILRDHPDGLNITELSRLSGLHRNAVSRHLAALGRHRLVTRQGHTYLLGLGIVELNEAVRHRLRGAATAELQTLADACRATAFITVLDTEDEAVVLTVSEPRGSNIHVAYRAGNRHPADQGASGIAILIGRPPRQGERQAVTRARCAGYSVTSGELQPGAWGLAAPILPGSGPAEASIGIVTIGEREDETTIAPLVLSAAERIARLL